MKHTVEVRARWDSVDTFEFDTEADAQQFRECVNGGGDAALQAIIDAGDITTSGASLVDFEAH